MFGTTLLFDGGPIVTNGSASAAGDTVNCNIASKAAVALLVFHLEVRDMGSPLTFLRGAACGRARVEPGAEDASATISGAR